MLGEKRLHNASIDRSRRPSDALYVERVERERHVSALQHVVIDGLEAIDCGTERVRTKPLHVLSDDAAEPTLRETKAVSVIEVHEWQSVAGLANVHDVALEPLVRIDRRSNAAG